MDFLKDVLGEELYKQVVSAVDAFNGKEENKDKQVKIGNIGSGEYVGKGKYFAVVNTVAFRERLVPYLREIQLFLCHVISNPFRTDMRVSALRFCPTLRRAR